MTDPAPLPRADRLVLGEAPDARPLRLVEPDGLEPALGALEPAQRAWVEASGFRARLGQLCLVPGRDGAPALALFGHGDAAARARSRFDLGKAAEALPEGTWALDAPEEHQAEAALGWLLSRTRFDRYRKGAEPRDVRLAVPGALDAERLHAIADGVALTRWLIDTPANDMGPAEIEAAARALAAEFGAEVASTVGEDLLAANFPLVHAVGRAAAPSRG